MSLIKHIKHYPAHRGSVGRRALLLCGFGGSIWQLGRLIRRLQGDGYAVTALDFSETVLSRGDPALLPQLVDEVVAYADAEARAGQEPILLVGVSLGALLSLNILRRSSSFQEAVMLTGGDIVKVAQNIYGARVWPQSYEELATLWADVNIYTEPGQLTGKHMLFVLPAKDRLINPEDVRREAAHLKDGGVDLTLIERHWFGHIGTIIEETVLFPARTIGYIRQLRRG